MPRTADGESPARRVSPRADVVTDLADVFGLLGDPGRLRILTVLLDGPLRVRDLAALADASESATSHALRLLRAHRVVKVERLGREAFYEIDDVHVRALLQLALDHVGHSVLTHVAGGDPAETCAREES